ncbi:MAG: hypothetical protein L0Z54_02805 [Thermoplasmata archaeon]|nr:hypothetical protein [Thermoplasmata archaeon]
MRSGTVPFSGEHMDLLGLWAEGIFEALVAVEGARGRAVRPMGIHVHGDLTLHIDVYLPSALGGLGVGERLRLWLPAYRDIDMVIARIVGREIDQPDGLPGLVAEVSDARRMTLMDGYGEAAVERLTLRPVASALPPGPWSPICRAHGHILEAAVLLTKPSHEGAAEHLREARRTAPTPLRELADSMENVI